MAVRIPGAESALLALDPIERRLHRLAGTPPAVVKGLIKAFATSTGKSQDTTREALIKNDDESRRKKLRSDKTETIKTLTGVKAGSRNKKHKLVSFNPPHEQFKLTRDGERLSLGITNLKKKVIKEETEEPVLYNEHEVTPSGERLLIGTHTPPSSHHFKAAEQAGATGLARTGGDTFRANVYKKALKDEDRDSFINRHIDFLSDAKTNGFFDKESTQRIASDAGYQGKILNAINARGGGEVPVGSTLLSVQGSEFSAKTKGMLPSRDLTRPAGTMFDPHQGNWHEPIEMVSGGSTTLTRQRIMDRLESVFVARNAKERADDSNRASVARIAYEQEKHQKALHASLGHSPETLDYLNNRYTRLRNAYTEAIGKQYDQLKNNASTRIKTGAGSALPLPFKDKFVTEEHRHAAGVGERLQRATSLRSVGRRIGAKPSPPTNEKLLHRRAARSARYELRRKLAPNYKNLSTGQKMDIDERIARHPDMKRLTDAAYSVHKKKTEKPVKHPKPK